MSWINQGTTVSSSKWITLNHNQKDVPKISRKCAAQSPHLVRDSVQEEDLHRLQQGGQPCLQLDPGWPLVDGMKIQLVPLRNKWKTCEKPWGHWGHWGHCGSSTLRVQSKQPFYHKNPMACAAAHRATLRSLLGPDLHAFGEEHLVNLPWWTHWDNMVQCLAATHPDAIPDRFSRTENGITNTPSGFCLKIGYGWVRYHIPTYPQIWWSITIVLRVTH